MEVTDDCRIVVVMGTTGSGKSRLVRLATGDESVQIGESLRSGQLSPFKRLCFRQ